MGNTIWWAPLLSSVPHGAGKNNERINKQHTIDKKCSHTLPTYPSAFILLSNNAYLCRKSFFGVSSAFRLLQGGRVPNKPINQVCYREQTCRATKTTYYCAWSWIFSVKNKARTTINCNFEPRIVSRRQRESLIVYVQSIKTKSSYLCS
jgi:hypothetical protein